MFYILRRRGLGFGSTKAIKELSQHDITIVRNDAFPTNLQDGNIILRWGCTSLIPVPPNTVVLNNSAGIHIANSKSFFRNVLQENAPKIVPKTWFNYLSASITYPCILRPGTHAQGKNLSFCQNFDELRKAYLSKPCFLETQYYISEYIPKVAEYRVCFIQGLVAWVANKIPKDPQAIAWNVAQGGKFENVSWKKWPIDVIETAYKAYKLSGLYLGGVDVMVDKDGRSYVLEINSAPSHTSPYRKQCTTKCIDYGITYKNFAHLPPDENFKKYGKWLHPALK